MPTLRLLLLSLYFHPDPAANSVILTGLAQRLANPEHHVRIVSALPHYDTNGIWPTFQGRLFQRDRLGDIDVTRVWLYVPGDKTRFLGRIANYLSFNLLSTFAGLLGPRPDVILAPSPPLTIGLSAWLLGLLRRAPYIYNVQDIYPDVAIRLGALKGHVAIRFFSWMERFVYRHAAAVTVISEGFRQNLLRKGVPSSKITVIPNFVDTEFVQPGSKDNAFSRREGLGNRFVVLFAGNVGLSQGLEYVLAAAQLLQSHPDILFLIVGNGSAKAALEDRARQLRLPNVCFLPFQPREALPNLYASADLCLVPLRQGIAQESVPSKALTIMAAGRPVVASVDSNSDIASCIQRAACGLCVPPEDPHALAAAILELHADPVRRHAFGVRGRQYVCAHYTPDTVARQYAALLSRVAAECKPRRVASRARDISR